MPAYNSELKRGAVLRFQVVRPKRNATTLRLTTCVFRRYLAEVHPLSSAKAVPASPSLPHHRDRFFNPASPKIKSSLQHSSAVCPGKDFLWHPHGDGLGAALAHPSCGPPIYRNPQICDL